MFRLLFAAIVLLVCCTKKGTPIIKQDSLLFPGTSAYNDTFNRIDLYPRPGVAGDTSGQFFYGFSFKRVVNIAADTPIKGDTTIINFQSRGVLQLQYVPADSLLLTDSIKRIAETFLDYRLPKNLLGKQLFQGFEIWDSSAPEDTLYYWNLFAAADSVRVVVNVSGFKPNATPGSISRGFNSLLLVKLDTSFFYRPSFFQ